MATIIKIIHIDKDKLVRECVARKLSKYVDIDVLGFGDSFYTSHNLIEKFKPDILLSNTMWSDDIALPYFEVLKTRFPFLKIVLFTFRFSKGMAVVALKNRYIDGFVGKSQDVEDLYSCLNSVAAGKPLFWIPNK